MLCRDAWPENAPPSVFEWGGGAAGPYSHQCTHSGRCVLHAQLPLLMSTQADAGEGAQWAN